MDFSRPEAEELFVNLLLEKLASMDYEDEYYDEDYDEDYYDDEPVSIIDFLYR